MSDAAVATDRKPAAAPDVCAQLRQLVAPALDRHRRCVDVGAEGERGSRGTGGRRTKGTAPAYPVMGAGSVTTVRKAHTATEPPPRVCRRGRRAQRCPTTVCTTAPATRRLRATPEAQKACNVAPTPAAPATANGAPRPLNARTTCARPMAGAVRSTAAPAPTTRHVALAASSSAARAPTLRSSLVAAAAARRARTGGPCSRCLRRWRWRCVDRLAGSRWAPLSC